MSSDTFDTTKSIGIDLNAYNIAVSNNVDFIKESNISDVKLGHLIDNGATNRRALKYKSNVVVLLRKQSRTGISNYLKKRIGVVWARN